MADIERTEEDPIESITIKFHDGATKRLKDHYFLAIPDDVEEGVYAAYLKIPSDVHDYLDLMHTLGSVQSHMADIIREHLHDHGFIDAD